MSMLQESERDGGTFYYVLPGTRRGTEGVGMGGRQRRAQSEEAPQRPRYDSTPLRLCDGHRAIRATRSWIRRVHHIGRVNRNGSYQHHHHRTEMSITVSTANDPTRPDHDPTSTPSPTWYRTPVLPPLFSSHLHIGTLTLSAPPCSKPAATRGATPLVLMLMFQSRSHRNTS